MAIMEEFPPFKLCALCKGIFPSADDPNADESIQSQIWTNDKGYCFIRTREEIERGAMESCEFCTDIVQDDRAYKKDRSPDRQNETTNKEDDYEWRSEEADEGPYYIAMFSGPRAGWFPSMDQKLGFKIKFHSEYKHLAVYDSNDRLMGRTWCLYTTPDNPASKLIHAEATLAEFGSVETFGSIRKWLGECVDGHPECPGDKPRELPTGLIMVSPLGTGPSARLCETLGNTGQYCALSYCWGGDQVHKTTREKYDAYLRELPYEELPQTIRDAFQVARSVGVTYI
ncbi:HET domain-containing protein [Fusarium sp. LHS14.1]|nr:HET domain-containing protein [Fusarium sp. LHS14.1]